MFLEFCEHLLLFLCLVIDILSIPWIFYPQILNLESRVVPFNLWWEFHILLLDLVVQDQNRYLLWLIA